MKTSTPQLKSDNGVAVTTTSPRRMPFVQISTTSSILFASGAAALIYQIIWIRLLSLVVGIDVFAVTLAISSFFAGLAVGSFVFGLFSERTKHPVRLYALLELLIAVTGLASTLLLARLPAIFVMLEETSVLLAWCLPILLVCIPASFMGGTLPVAVKAFLRNDNQLGVEGGRLYAANTTGAIVGTLLTAYLLIPSLGLFGASVAAATLNLVSATSAYFCFRQTEFDQPTHPSAKTPLALEQQGARLGLCLYAVAGGIALGYEVVWSQIIVQWTSTRSFAFATVLAVYLTGLAVGSGIGSWRLKYARDRWGSFGVLIALAGMIALLQMMSLGPWLDQLQVYAATFAFKAVGNEHMAMFARFVTAAGCVLFVPATLLGAAFPFALQLNESSTVPGTSSGLTIAANTLGGIVGTALTGFLIVPAIGVERTLAALAVAAGIVGAIACIRAKRSHQWIVAALLLITIIESSLVSPEQFGKLLAMRRKGALIHFSSGAGGSVAVIEQGNKGRRFRRLYIQGVSNSGDSMTSLRYMRLQALLPLIIHSGQPKSALVIGLGTGITAGSLLNYDGLNRRVCAEVLPQVVDAAAYFEGNVHAVNDPRLEIRRIDGRHALLRQVETYDLITLEPPPPSASGVANLYSVEFYQLAKSRLEPRGIVAQWLPLPTQNDADTRSLVRSFLDAFPYASLWSTELHEMLLVGSTDSLSLDAVTIEQRFEQATVKTSLTEVGIATPAALLATFVCDRPQLEDYCRNAQPVTDDRPRIEYGPWTVPGEFPRTFRNLMALKSDSELINASDRLRSEVRDERAALNLFYDASIAAYEGDRKRWDTAMRAAIYAAPDNAYFRWFKSGSGGASP